MKTIRSFRDLTVWQKSFDLVEKVYLLTSKLPQEEKFGIISQIQRTAVSIPSNIAEGYARNNRKEYLQFVGIARGSGAELETQLLLIQKIYKLDLAEELSLLTEIRKMLTVLNQSLRQYPISATR
ncbi:four helix bundle protein [Candidatus Saccharibacteria bacterium]|nr:four helix bundle protein [Candidatus Saccharibacteria bacterium]